jgi:hypothetical protein
LFVIAGLDPAIHDELHPKTETTTNEFGARSSGVTSSLWPL